MAIAVEGFFLAYFPELCGRQFLAMSRTIMRDALNQASSVSPL